MFRIPPGRFHLAIMAGPQFSVRRATAEDIAGILQCLRLAFEPYRTRYSPAGFVDTVLTPALLRDRLQTMAVFVALDQSAVVGTIGAAVATAREGHLRGMAVDPARQGSGVAERLLQAAENHLRAAGCGRVTLDTTEPLERAMRFYERHGYRRSGKVADFFGMPLLEYVKGL
jgi:ribosomal protein S18 acetylase RimI-like enzyme